MTHDHRQEIIDKAFRIRRWFDARHDTHIATPLVLAAIDRIIKERKIFRDDLIKLNSLCKNWAIK